MQNYLKTLLNFRKNSKAIHEGETLHYAPKDGVYLLSRKHEDEIEMIQIPSMIYEFTYNLFNEYGALSMTKKILRYTD